MVHLKNNQIVSASTLNGMRVENLTGDKVGEIKDIMLNTVQGDISYVVLSVDTGFLNMGSKYFAIPFEVLKFDSHQEDVIIFNIDKERLENSPGFDKDNWPSGPQMEFVGEVYSYYGVEQRRYDRGY